MHGGDRHPRSAFSASSLVNASSNSSGTSGNSISGQSSSLAVATAGQKMDSELRCPACRRYFYCPLLLPCGHSLCTSCAAAGLLPATEPHVAAAIQAALTLPTTDQYNTAAGASFSSASSTTGSSSGCSSQPFGQNQSQASHIPTSTIHHVSSAHSDSDQVSVLSETDSGVVVTSRPGSYIARTSVLASHSNGPSSSLNTITHGLICPACNRIIALLDDKGIGHLPRNRALERVVFKFASPEMLQQNLIETTVVNTETFPLLSATDPLNRPGGPLCQLCEEPEKGASEQTGNVASVWCEQCEIFYCTSCREKCHPSRGPLVRHALHSAAKGVEIVRRKRQNQPPPCLVHSHSPVTFYCLNCQVAVCTECLESDGNLSNETHGKHEVQPLNSACKSKKTELSQALQALSEKARTGTEFIQQLRSRTEGVNQKMLESERLVIAQLNLLLEVLEKKKLELTNRLREARESKVCSMKGQISQITGLLTRSTGLIQFCIEMLKESDPSAFMVVSQSLIMRARDAEYHFTQELDQAVPTSDQEDLDVYQYPASPDHEMHLSKGVVRKVSHKNMRKYDRNVSETSLHGNAVEAIRQAILELHLQEDQTVKTYACELEETTNRKREVPAPPMFLVEECISERNVITLVWQPSSTTSIDRYTLELDDGANGNFRKVYRGPETICTVEGLHFRSVYRARVKAHNQVGESAYSERICLQTSDFTWFHLDSTVAAPEILLTNGNRTVTSQVAEDRVIIGSTGLSRGVHYWEFTVDRCDAGGQPAFGIARQDCNKEIMLGLDMRSWSVYFDHKRSWFLHNGEHFERTDGGVRAGSVVGVRFDCNRGTLSYYLNDEPHGPIAFTNLPPGVYYPAVSLTRAIQLTLHCGLEAPSESEESDEDSSGGGTGTETTSMATTVLGQPQTGPTASHMTPRS
ncbi:hypothetical protein CRM22_009213 [Opisthorchis felineus]|nr:hypothetical protein CRM22_009213 [Opisthorchis felineus]